MADISRNNFDRIVPNNSAVNPFVCPFGGTGNAGVNAGTNLYLAVGFMGQSGKTVTSVVWDPGGAAQTMALLSTETGGDRPIWMYGLVNPTTGPKNVEVTWSAVPDAFVGFAEALYDVGQSGQPHAADTDVGVNANSLTATLTTSVDKCWLCALSRDNTGGTVTWNNVISQSGPGGGPGGGVTFADSNGVVATGSNNIVATLTGALQALIGVALAPPSGAVSPVDLWSVYPDWPR